MIGRDHNTPLATLAHKGDRASLGARTAEQTEAVARVCAQQVEVRRIAIDALALDGQEGLRPVAIAAANRLRVGQSDSGWRGEVRGRVARLQLGRDRHATTDEQQHANDDPPGEPVHPADNDSSRRA